MFSGLEIHWTEGSHPSVPGGVRVKSPFCPLALRRACAVAFCDAAIRGGYFRCLSGAHALDTKDAFPEFGAEHSADERAEQLE